MKHIARLRSLTGLVISACCFAACSVPQITRESPEVNSVAVNSRFRIILPEDHSKGYLWQLKDDFDHVVENTNTVWHGNEKGIYFDFKALKKGKTTLTLINRRYADTLFVKSFIVEVSDK